MKYKKIFTSYYFWGFVVGYYLILMANSPSLDILYFAIKLFSVLVLSTLLFTFAWGIINVVQIIKKRIKER